jgi:serine/threonine protein kinase
MENQDPGLRPPVRDPGDALATAPPETKTVRATDTPDENDPLWEVFGTTKIGAGKIDIPSEASPIIDGLVAASNFTELSPSRVLGKNLVKIGEYRLIRKIGEGAMGAVYKAEQTSRKRVVALKVLFPHIANNQKLVDRMQREGQVMGLLDHENIIQAYEYNIADGCHYVAMEYVSGQSMQKWLIQLGSLSVEDSVRLALDCAKALAYAHANNIIHRDIKPDNILVTKSGRVKVADLGMAKTHDEDMSLTQTGHAVGTPWYMPIEQARNAKEIDGRSDIYALGCTLYAFLTGNPPFMGRTIVDVIQAKEIGRFPPARKFNSAVPDRLDMILVKMTAKLPKNRYQNCDEVIRDLESLNLASKSLAFLKRRAENKASDESLPIPEPAAAPSGDVSASATMTGDVVSTVNEDVWYVQTKLQDGSLVARKYLTAQLLKMLAEGTMTPNARISRSPSEGFRSIATYKEFQGTALSKASRQNADKAAIRYRNLYKKIEEQERKRDDNQTQEPENQLRANTRYWLGVLLPGLSVGFVVIGLCGLVYWLMSR